MTFEERTAAIGRLLRETILPRYTRPEHLDMDTARREVSDMVADLNAAWPLMSAERFGDVCDGMARAVRTTHTSRQWPTIAALVKSLKRALEPPAVVSDGDKRASEEAIYELVRGWWQEFRGPLPSVANEGHAIRLEREGLASWGQLRRSGFAIPSFAVDEAMSEPDPNHDAIMASLRDIGDRLRANEAPRGDIRRPA